MIRCRMASLAVVPGLGALCQAGFWLRNDVAADGAARCATGGAAAGVSLTYGNNEVSSLLVTCSYAIIDRRQ